MSLYIDISYLKQLSPRLPLFKQKGDFLWNCRCILCGDSDKKKTKTRGYFYRSKQNLYYKCHNCGASMHFGTFLKDVDPALYDQYYFERFAKGEGGRAAHKAHPEELFADLEPQRELVLGTPIIGDSVLNDIRHQPEWEDDLLRGVCTNLTDLPRDHEARVYCAKRMLPFNELYRLWFVPQVKDMLAISPEKYQKSLNSEEPRLVIPFHKENGKIVGVTLRGIRDEKLRYITVRFEEDADLTFGLNQLDKTQPITVLEGQFDSLFIPNSIACGGTSFGKIELMGLPKDQLTIVFDNQPRNLQVCELMEKYVKLGFKVCIWPQEIQEKDVNEMIQAGRDPVAIIRDNTYRGLDAELQFSKWRKIR